MTDILNQTKWGKTALTLISHINSAEEKVPTFIVMRHSQREEPESLEEMANAPLTPLGTEASQEFGKKLLDNRKYRLYSSYVGRCQDTAKNITEGIRMNDGNAEYKGILVELTDLNVNPALLNQAFEKYGLKLVGPWIDGELSEINLNPPLNFAQKAWNKIQQQLDPETVNIYVSHDFHSLIYLYYWTGVRAIEQWIQYSEGFMIQQYPDFMKLSFQGETKQIPYPDWWKK